VLVIDKREPLVMIQELEKLAAKDDIPTSREMLKYGDWNWESPLGSVKMERKSVSDLLGSLRSGRADRQFANLIDNADVPLLLLEGKIGELNGHITSGKPNQRWQALWQYSSVDHLLLSWQMAGLYVAHSPSQSKTPNRVISLYKYTQKAEHAPRRNVKIDIPRNLSPQVATLVTLPGVGIKRATALARYPLEGLFSLTQEEWQELVGKATAAKIYKYITEYPIRGSSVAEQHAS
jgi:ERCC4-type nuclease